MITLDVQITGSQIGYTLAADPEELAYALVAIATGTPASLPAEMAEHVSEHDKAKTAAFLRGLANRLSPAELEA